MRRSGRLAKDPLNLAVRPSKKGEILTMQRLGFLGNNPGATVDVDNARKEYDRFFNDTLGVKNFPALRDLLPAARGLTDEELLAAVQHAGTLV